MKIKPILSVLICTTSVRSEIIKPLLVCLKQQMSRYPDIVELIINDHETDNVGKKRNDLLLQATGEWQVAIDSDDMISDDYIPKILKALESNPDCVGISGIITTDGKNQKQWHISKDYNEWYEKNNVYLRTPNHISPIRTSIAKQVMFPEIVFGEDADFSKRIFPLLSTEVKVPGNIYHYRFKSKK